MTYVISVLVDIVRIHEVLHLRGEILTSKIITKKNFKVTNIFTVVPEENHQILSFFK